ncbi:RICIN domain-containing protein [Kutzneria kofuensis]|uniref:Ricin B lectin domain-containing protein n=1 Tax=Kutzneria kofuensis TaxID=103725 RepID=A0A7W9KRD5_9PSEU|nr:RICIN domain-containing protein [Kutzneria kofuensis]MBB5897222.1 hypothetical protein [Kutzneria kofuensis]
MRKGSWRAGATLAIALLSILVLGPTGIANAGAVSPAQPSAGWFEIVNVNSGKCLDVRTETGLYSNGAHIQQYSCGDAAGQKWWVWDVGNGYYKISNEASGKCLNVVGGWVGWGVPIEQWDCSQATTSATWKIIRVADFPTPVYEFVTQTGGLCLDVPNASTANEVRLQTWGCNGTVAQQFTFR